MSKITALPCGMYQSYAAEFEGGSRVIEVCRDAIDGISTLSVRNRMMGHRICLDLTDDELDTLATMLRDAYNSQEREE